MQSKIKKHTCTELLIDLIQGALEEEGCHTKRFSDGDTYFTTSYDCIMIEDVYNTEDLFEEMTRHGLDRDWRKIDVSNHNR